MCSTNIAGSRATFHARTNIIDSHALNYYLDGQGVWDSMLACFPAFS